jgi:2-polyprenyl-6-methoxyphenol hydroxylase-like FAD-dependent oxidoreductase
MLRPSAGTSPDGAPRNETQPSARPEHSRGGPFFTPVYDFAAPRFVFGRVALVGDAAATARPHMGFGVSKAGGDALALAEALGGCDDIDAALVRYDAQRRTIAERVVMHGRSLGTFLGVNVKTEEDRIMGKLLSDHHGQMDWFAVPNFLTASAIAPNGHPVFID